MTTTHIMHSKRKGVSTILGTLIFIGILFTSVIPMMLVMKQADTIYTQRVHERQIRDQERDSEDLDANGFPVNETSPELKVRITNRGVVPVRIVRVWVNNMNFTEDTVIASQETVVMGPYLVNPVSGSSYVVKIVTSTGSVFPTTAGTLHFTDGFWFTPSLGVHVLVLNWWGKYKIRVYNSTWTSADPYSTVGTDIGDVEWTEIGMDVPGNYWVEVLKKVGGDYDPLPGSPIPVVIQWPGGSPVINVIADGRDV